MCWYALCHILHIIQNSWQPLHCLSHSVIVGKPCFQSLGSLTEVIVKWLVWGVFPQLLRGVKNKCERGCGITNRLMLGLSLHSYCLANFELDNSNFICKSVPWCCYNLLLGHPCHWCALPCFHHLYTLLSYSSNIFCALLIGVFDANLQASNLLKNEKRLIQVIEARVIVQEGPIPLKS